MNITKIEMPKWMPGLINVNLMDTHTFGQFSVFLKKKLTDNRKSKESTDKKISG